MSTCKLPYEGSHTLGQISGWCFVCWGWHEWHGIPVFRREPNREYSVCVCVCVWFPQRLAYFQLGLFNKFISCIRILHHMSNVQHAAVFVHTGAAQEVLDFPHLISLLKGKTGFLDSCPYYSVKDNCHHCLSWACCIFCFFKFSNASVVHGRSCTTLSQSAWSFYQGKSNFSGVSLQILKV